MNKKECKYRAYPRPLLYFEIHSLGLVACITMFVLLSEDYGELFKSINIILAIVLPILLVISFVYSTFFGWNAVVVFNGEKVSQRQGLEYVEWKWEDIRDISFRTNVFVRGLSRYYPPKVEIISSLSKKKIVFTLNRNLMNVFTDLCTNEEINLKFKQLIVTKSA